MVGTKGTRCKLSARVMKYRCSTTRSDQECVRPVNLYQSFVKLRRGITMQLTSFNTLKRIAERFARIEPRRQRQFMCLLLKLSKDGLSRHGSENYILNKAPIANERKLGYCKQLVAYDRKTCSPPTIAFDVETQPS